MSTINSNTQTDRSRLSSFAARSIQRMMLHDASTGLNPQGNTQFRNRVGELMKENGLKADFAFGKNGEGKFILLQDHPDKEKIESLLNSDEKLTQIRNDPANTFDTSKGGVFRTNGYDSAHFSEEARKMYAESEKNGVPAPYASSAEDTAAVMEWAANKEYKVIHNLAPGEELPMMRTGLSFEAAKDAAPLNPEDVAFLKSDKINELKKTRDWLETEITSLLEESGIDSKDLKGIKFAFNGGKIGVLAGQEGVSKELGEKINGIINSPKNEQLKSIMDKYLGEAASLADELKGVTGLSDADWAEVMAGGGGLANVDNDGMKALLAADPGLESALSSLFGDSGLLAPAQETSSRDGFANVARAFGSVVWDAVKGGKENGLGLTDKDIVNLSENLTIELKGDGAFNVSGTDNKKLPALISEYAAHYTSGPFADMMKSAALLSQALGGAKSGDDMSFSFNFKGRQPNATFRHGDDAPQIGKSAEQTYW